GVDPRPDMFRETFTSCSSERPSTTSELEVAYANSFCAVFTPTAQTLSSALRRLTRTRTTPAFRTTVTVPSSVPTTTVESCLSIDSAATAFFDTAASMVQERNGFAAVRTSPCAVTTTILSSRESKANAVTRSPKLDSCTRCGLASTDETRL